MCYHSSYWGYLKEEVLDCKPLFVLGFITALLTPIVFVLIATMIKENILLYVTRGIGLGLAINLLVVVVAAFFAFANWLSRDA